MVKMVVLHVECWEINPNSGQDISAGLFFLRGQTHQGAYGQSIRKLCIEKNLWSFSNNANPVSSEHEKKSERTVVVGRPNMDQKKTKASSNISP